ncbi:MFS transporter [Oryzihumus leptocrescens]|uniref:Putative MFS family arabinose efflux permease n=1 Tax=Oryzihumus leptocrescens TaxID=297536 RepID=A0A542ZKF2_9MICO|nr:MFS transporter [Oryzihumus leptocrescens]TQL60831.1 putative MFS family arabinose efflux permease [Oryzihumus leptocrescens]
MPFAPYRRVLAVPAARTALLLGLFLRIPMFAGGVVLTLHIVQTLHRGYAEAGVVSALATICIAISGPWRGRLLDRIGLRRTVVPSIIVTALVWSVAPFVGYLPLLLLAIPAGLFVTPTFSILRQAIITAVPDAERRTALSLDSVGVELSFMLGPVLGVWAATTWSTTWVLFAAEMLTVVGAIAVWVVNPVMRSEGHDADAAHLPRREWFSGAFLAVLAAAAATTLVLSGCDVAFVAAMRGYGAVGSLGPVLAVWGLGSALGGLVYGALHRSLPVFALLAGLGIVTVPLALASGPVSLALLSFVAGLFCAPTITATVDAVSRVVDERARGEAMGWHGSAMTAGSALGAPVAGAAIDLQGYAGGFALVGLLGVLVATSGWATVRLRRRRRAAVDVAAAA